MKSQKGSILPIIILIILLAGIVITLSLTKQVNIFKSKADLNQIVFTGAGVSTQNGQLITDSPTVLVQVTSPNTFNSNSQVQGVSTSRKLLAQSNPDAGLPCSTSEGTGIYEADGSCTITAPSAPFPVSGDSCADGRGRIDEAGNCITLPLGGGRDVGSSCDDGAGTMQADGTCKHTPSVPAVIPLPAPPPNYGGCIDGQVYNLSAALAGGGNCVTPGSSCSITGNSGTFNSSGICIVSSSPPVSTGSGPSGSGDTGTKYTVCNGQKKTSSELQSELQRAGYNGASDINSILAAYNNAACGGQSPSQAGNNPAPVTAAQTGAVTTVGFRLAESPDTLQNAAFFGYYTSSPVRLLYTFGDKNPGVKVLYVQFKDSRGNLSTPVNSSIRLQDHPSTLSVPGTPQKSCKSDNKIVTVSWPRVSGVSGYQVRMDKNPGNSPWFDNADRVGGDYLSNNYAPDPSLANPSIDLDIVPNTPYKFWVHAYNSKTTSDASENVTFQCP